MLLRSHLFLKTLKTHTHVCLTFRTQGLWATTPTSGEKMKRNTEVSLLLPNTGTTYNYNGGIMNAVSLGKRGWMACGLGPDKFGFTDVENSKIGVIRLPTTHTAYAEDQKGPETNAAKGVHDSTKCLENGKADADCCAAPDASKCADGYKFYYTGKNCKSHYQIFECWKPDPATDPTFKYNWRWLDTPAKTSPDKAARVGMVNLAHFSKGGENSGRLLIGWTPAMATQGLADEFVVSEVTVGTDDGAAGKLAGEPLKLVGGGWGEDNVWTYMAKTGCVAAPTAWMGKAPGGSFTVTGTGKSNTCDRSCSDGVLVLVL